MSKALNTLKRITPNQVRTWYSKGLEFGNTQEWFKDDPRGPTPDISPNWEYNYDKQKWTPSYKNNIYYKQTWDPKKIKILNDRLKQMEYGLNNY